MKLALYGILVILALFIVLMVFNPRLSCFGKKLRSPFYPMVRKRKQRERQLKTTDYGFDLDSPAKKQVPGTRAQRLAQPPGLKTRKNLAAQDYGFDLHGENKGEKG